MQLLKLFSCNTNNTPVGGCNALLFFTSGKNTLNAFSDVEVLLSGEDRQETTSSLCVCFLVLWPVVSHNTFWHLFSSYCILSILCVSYFKYSIVCVCPVFDDFLFFYYLQFETIKKNTNKDKHFLAKNTF